VDEAEALRRAAASRRRQVLMDRERRKTDRPNEDTTADKKYTDLIERGDRETRANQDQSEGSHETEP
jgi:hypothetical protein